jgi:hypothetical protein
MGRLMAENDQQVLNLILKSQNSGYPDLSEPDFFEYFCADQILKDYDLSEEDIQRGIVDGEHDGGADSVYAFVNGELIPEDKFDTSPFKKDVSIELHIIQSKSADGFSENAIDKLIALTTTLLKINADDTKIPQYNESVKSVLNGFRSAYSNLVGKFPSLSINYYYAAKKADQHIHPNTQAKADALKIEASRLFPEATVKFDFIAAPKLVEMARRKPRTIYNLETNKIVGSGRGYVSLVTLSAYNNFLRDEHGKLNRELFDSNVRDFQGSTEVNDDIMATLKGVSQVDFWEMNNGVTILSSKAILNGDTVVIENPQIVNGLQTSSQIASYFDGGATADKRQVMIKVVAFDDEETRDKIIKATNFQNRIEPASLRATDKVQRDIEEALYASGLFYDRRKNFYKNLGKPAAQIISIPLLAQATMSLILARPDNARARPSSLLKDDGTYESVFSEKTPVQAYVKATKLLQLVDSALRTNPDIARRERTNIRFFVLYWLGAEQAGRVNPSAAQLAKIKTEAISAAQVGEAISVVSSLYHKSGASDQAAKGTALRDAVTSAMKTEIIRRAHAEFIG